MTNLTITENEDDHGFATWEIGCEVCERVTMIYRTNDNYETPPGFCPYCGAE